MKKYIFTILVIFLLNFAYGNIGAPMKKTIMIDLDGVLDNYTKYTDDIPGIKEGAREFIEKLYSTNKYELILFTTRSLKKAVVWLQMNNIDKYFIDVVNTKHPAYIYIDDRAIKFEGDYNKTLKDIEEFRVYWK